MKTSRALVAISLDQDRLVAVCGVAGSGRVKVRSWLSVQAPESLELRDAAAVGAWLGAELDKAGLARSRLIIAVPRGDVVLKRLKLPRADGANAQLELAGMVRLQMSRQLTMAIEGTAIDYVPIEGGSGETLDVLAGALPADRMQWYRDMAEAAGCEIERIGLRASGAAALLAAASHRHNGAIVGVALGWSTIEFIVVKDGQLVFARAADVGVGASQPAGPSSAEATVDGEALSARVAVEAKRTWMGYRVGDEAAAVEAVVVPGAGPLAREAGEACGKALEMPWELAESSSIVEFDAAMSEVDKLVAGPLIGLLGEEILARKTLDFAHPRKAPDLAAARRMRILAAALGLIIIGGGGYVFSGLEVERAEKRLQEAKERGAALRLDYAAYLKDHARLSHIEKWRAAGFDWLSHAAWLSEQMPDPRQAQLDQLSGFATINVELTPNNGRYDVNGWKVSQRANFSIQGKARQREVANELRDRLVSSPVYQVETKGADMADRFAMALQTSAPRPEDAKPAPNGGKPAAGKGGGS